jgi:uncharacterized protein (DUF488 family)
LRKKKKLSRSKILEIRAVVMDYKETDMFWDGINELVKDAIEQRTAYMCSEAVWWRCHRAMISII